ncbi:MAG: type II toxin-antitoxin system RelE/ParE family toxin [Zetaproteobacteria bacterium]|nr:MAG: type II toxin-antitoxin system RelE/ParE family toxin [Zetaproteobacteria bacterium]
MTVCYRVVIKRSAERELRAIPVPDLPRVVARVQGLANQPRPSGCEKLSGQDRYRIRQGDYRIVYAVSDKERLVEIIRIGHRREVYRT